MFKAKINMNGEDFWFASLDGEEFIEISREPETADLGAVEELIHSRAGTRIISRAMRYTKGWLLQHGGIVKEVK